MKHSGYLAVKLTGPGTEEGRGYELSFAEEGTHAAKEHKIIGDRALEQFFIEMYDQQMPLERKRHHAHQSLLEIQNKGSKHLERTEITEEQFERFG